MENTETNDTLTMQDTVINDASDLPENYNEIDETSEVVSESPQEDIEAGHGPATTVVENAAEEAADEKEVSLRLPGDPNTFIYVGMELSNNSATAQMLSICLKDADNRCLYAEVTDIDFGSLTTDVLKNIVPTLSKPKFWKDFGEVEPSREYVFEKDTKFSGTLKTVTEAVRAWIQYYPQHNHIVQFVADVPANIWLHLTEILGDKDNDYAIPEWISPDIVDLNEQIATYLIAVNVKTTSENGEPTPEEIKKASTNYSPLAKAFKINRIDLLSSIGVSEMLNPDTTETAIIKATVAKIVHQYIWGFESDDEEKDDKVENTKE